MKKILFAVLLMMCANGVAFADTITIKQFVIKENPFADSEVAIVATDTAGAVQERVEGLFAFTINGFREQMRFEKGTAFYRHKLDKSAFFYVKHVNNTGTHSMLYYIYKQDGKLRPIHVSWVLLVIIPLALVLLGYMFKRFIIIAIVIFCIFLYFNHHNGLSMPTFFESIFDGLRGLF
ncbi:hypothetical protein HK413_07800 [Mucilaginibacter sp. S1162]|uniref:Uncharacterized protein n=1 Tax=Mucilaginibacter humi TaxID=2732510 RepID=A0ABX1W1H1_9SPHI|nr:hypothetical protein [Mucilaginibacter humi]NNU34077.1 hypothetical protein [Mucilaginibacter humi]